MSFAKQIVKLAEDVGLVKKTAATGKRVACILFVDECDFKNIAGNHHHLYGPILDTPNCNNVVLEK